MLHYPAERWVHCGHKRMDMVSNDTAVFKQCSTTKRSKVWQENVHTITSPAEPLTQNMMDSCSKILTLPSECRSRNRDSSDQATFFQSVVQFWSACANCSLSILFLAERRTSSRFFFCSASRFNVLCVQRSLITRVVI